MEAMVCIKWKYWLTVQPSSLGSIEGGRGGLHKNAHQTKLFFGPLTNDILSSRVQSHNHLLSQLDSMEDFEIAEAQSFAEELEDQLNKLIEKDVRIILGNFDESWARRIFCEAYRKKMYGKNYQWIITGEFYPLIVF